MFPSVPPPPPPPPEEVGKEEGAVETAMKEEAPSDAPSAAAGSGDDHAQAGRQTEDSTAKVLQEAFARGAPRCFFYASLRCPPPHSFCFLCVIAVSTATFENKCVT